MTLRSLAILGLVTACAVGLAVASSLSWSTDDAVGERGKVFAPAIAEGAQGIGEIVIEDASGKAVFTRNGTGFVDASGYPVRLEPVRDLIKSLSALAIEEKKTADAARHHELDLALPDAQSGAGRRVILNAADGAAVASLIVGKPDYSVGGGAGGQFVREDGNDQTYLVRGSVKLPFARADWFDNLLFDIGEAKIIRANLSGGSKDGLRFELKDDALSIADLPDEREANTDKIGRIGHNFRSPKFDDVRKSSGSGLAAARTLGFETDNGLAFTVRLAETVGENDIWVDISVTGTGPEVEVEAKTLQDKIGGFEFRLDKRTGEILTWTLDDLTTPRGS